MEIKNNINETGTFMLTGISSEWNDIVIPFNKMPGISKFTSMTELVIVFDDQNSNPKTGAIYFDDIYVGK